MSVPSTQKRDLTTVAQSLPAPSPSDAQDSSILASPARGTQPYPIMEITKTDATRQHALDALHHIETQEARHLTSIAPPALGPGPSPAEDVSCILAYIQKLENKVAALQNRNVSTSQENVHSQHLLSTDEVAASTSLQGVSEQPAYILEIKRFKKLNYRYGSAKYYDDSESVEAIRSREGALRGGGYVMNVFREYDWEGNTLNGKLEICCECIRGYCSRLL
jgi:hypothetical protein